MRKYLELFINGFDETITDKIKVENKPYIGYSMEEGKVVYTVIPKPVTGSYVTFTAEEDNSSIGLEKLSTNQTLEYSMDTTTWNTFDITTNISLNNGDKVYVRGVLSGDNTYSDYTHFKMTGKIAASGNCNAIWNYEDLNAPLKAYCGRYMFNSCTSLTTAPELPATKLVEYCYNGMFYGCAKLKHITCLAIDISASYCTSIWIHGVASTGTFVKHPNMEDWTTGGNSIPIGWTVIDAEL